MLVVRVELWSAITKEKTEIARAYIDNIGGSKTKGNYRIRTFKGRSSQALDKNIITRVGKVIDHPRLSEHVWNLVGKGLTNIGYGYGKNDRPTESS